MGKKRILVVEDEAITAMDLRARLVQLGYEVPLVVTNGEEAIRSASETLPDLVLMDITLDGRMSGIEAAEAIRRAQSIPVVFVTAHDDSHTIQNAKVAEPYGYITKPYSMGTLQSTIETTLYKSEMDSRLRESEERLRFHQDNSPMAIIESNADFMVTRWTGTAEKMFGWSREEAVGRSIKELRLFVEEEASRVPSVRQFSDGSENRLVSSSRNYTKQGKAIHCEWYSSAMRDSRGKLTSVLSKVLEVTARKQVEKALQEKNDELERLTYTVSHDLKSPLITFKTYLGYLEQDIAKKQGDRITQDLGFMSSATDKMAEMLEDILELSRVGRVEAAPVRVTFRELVDEALASARGLIAQKKVDVRVVQANVVFFGDRLRLAEIWQNLIENAVKYMGDQTAPRIELGAEVQAGTTVLYVRDNGMGIDPRHKDKVFGLFDKLDPKSEGSGLGLALVKRIVNMYGGTVWLESDGPGKGTCFKFTLPGAERAIE